MSELRQRLPRRRDERHLAFIRRLPCLICRAIPCEAAHVRMASEAHAKRQTGMAEKPDDRWTVPLCPTHHREQHARGEVEFWKLKDISVLEVAEMLCVASGDESTGRHVVRTHTYIPF